MTAFPTLLYSQLVKSLPFYIPEAWKRYPFQAEPPRIGHYREFPPPRACTLLRFLDTDELKMAVEARNIEGAFEKRAPMQLSENDID